MAHISEVYVEKSRVWPYLVVCGLPLSILLGPRIGLPGISSGDFRIQDFVIGASLLYFLVLDFGSGSPSPSSERFKALFWTVPLIALACLAVLVAETADMFRYFYVVRLVEPVLIALLMYRALDVLGRKGIAVFLTVTAASTVLNLAWVFAQTLFGSNRPLWRFGGQEIPNAYGPGLIGDIAPFPVGQVLVVMMAGLVSSELYSSNSPKLSLWLKPGLIVAMLLALIFVQSRVSVAGGLAAAVAWVFLFLRKNYTISAPLRSSLGFAALLVALAIFPRIPRFDVEGVQLGFTTRLELIFLPTLTRLEDQFLFGAGPASIRAETGWEYHSLYLGMLSNFGIVGLTIFLCLLVSIMWLAARSGANSNDPSGRVFGLWTVLILFNLLAVGLVQDSYIAAAPNHMGALVVGTWLWLFRRRLEITPRTVSNSVGWRV